MNCTNDIYKDDFKSKMDKTFSSKQKEKSTRGKPGLRELGMIPKNRKPSKRLWSATF